MEDILDLPQQIFQFWKKELFVSHKVQSLSLIKSQSVSSVCLSPSPDSTDSRNKSIRIAEISFLWNSKRFAPGTY